MIKMKLEDFNRLKAALSKSDEVFFEVVRDPSVQDEINLSQLPSETMQVVYNGNSEVVCYYQDLHSKNIEFNPNQILHLRRN